MPSIAITHTIYRNDEPIEIDAEGFFYNGGLNDWSVSGLPDGVELTQEEDDKIVELLRDEAEIDWDENKWESYR